VAGRWNELDDGQFRAYCDQQSDGTSPVRRWHYDVEERHAYLLIDADETTANSVRDALRKEGVPFGHTAPSSRPGSDGRQYARFVRIPQGSTRDGRAVGKPLLEEILVRYGFIAPAMNEDRAQRLMLIKEVKRLEQRIRELEAQLAEQSIDGGNPTT